MATGRPATWTMWLDLVAQVPFLWGVSLLLGPTLSTAVPRGWWFPFSVLGAELRPGWTMKPRQKWNYAQNNMHWMVSLNKRWLTFSLCAITAGLTPSLPQSAFAELVDTPFLGPQVHRTGSEDQGERLVSHSTKFLPESHFAL